jgi:fatty acid desaturase
MASPDVSPRILSGEELKALSAASGRIYRDLLANYAVLVAAFGALIGLQGQPLGAAQGLAYAAVFVVTGWAQLGLLNANHDGLHHHFGKPHRELLMRFLTAYPIGLTASFRDVHWAHHRHLGDPERDPDYGNYGRFPRSRAELLLRVVGNASGYVAIEQFLSGRTGAGRIEPGELARLVLTQLVLFALYSAFTQPLLYPLFWLAPLFTVGRLCSFLRTFCEHASATDDCTLRTFRGRKAQTLILGLYNFNYHAEHHLYPSIPYPRLPATSRLILTRSEPGQLYEVYEGGYLGLLRDWFVALPWRAGERVGD